jgi:hypothetical protein
LGNGEGYEDDPSAAPASNELLTAIFANDEKKVQELLAAGHDINDTGSLMPAPLWVAVQQMDPALVRRLLAAGADPRIAGPDQATPLQCARLLGQVLALTSGARPTAGQQGTAGRVHPFQGRLEEIIRLLEAAEAR